MWQQTTPLPQQHGTDTQELEHSPAQLLVLQGHPPTEGTPMRNISNPENCVLMLLGLQIKKIKTEDTGKENAQRLIFRGDSGHTCFNLNHYYEQRQASSGRF